MISLKHKQLNWTNSSSIMKKIQIMTLILTLSTNKKIKKTQIPSRSLSLQQILFWAYNLRIFRDLHSLCNLQNSQLGIKTLTILSLCLMTCSMSSFVFRISSIQITFLSLSTLASKPSLRKLLKLQCLKSSNVSSILNAVWVKNLCLLNAQASLHLPQLIKRWNII